MPCSIDGCERPAQSRGWCPRHYKRWWKHGDPLVTRRRGRVDRTPGARRRQPGPENNNWRGDAVSYGGAHDRVRRANGPPGTHTCPCGTTAYSWAYTHDDPNERDSPRGPYSTDPAFYRAMCASCHKYFDIEHAAD